MPVKQLRVRVARPSQHQRVGGEPERPLDESGCRDGSRQLDLELDWLMVMLSHVSPSSMKEVWVSVAPEVFAPSTFTAGDNFRRWYDAASRSVLGAALLTHRLKPGQVVLVQGEVAGGQVLLQVRHRRRAGDEQYPVVVGQQPGERHL
jgi:hypothetical protein